MRRALCAVATLAVLVTGGCGIPDRSDVRVLSDGPSSGVTVGDEGEPPVQSTRESTSDPREFVLNYLQAAAGDPVTAPARVKEFLAPEMAAGFATGNADVKVVRLFEPPLGSPGDPHIKISVQQVGTLKSNGELQPAADPTFKPKEYELQVGPVAGRTGIFVLSGPKFMLMTDTALATFYRRRTIYFWNSANTALVPDLRYMPVSVPAVQQPTTILSWLAGPPAQWLGDAVNGLAPGTQASDNVPAMRNGTLQISLNAAAVPPGSDPGTLDRLRRQLQWSMRPLVPRTLELRIGRDEPERYVDAEYLESNQAYALDEVPERFAVYNGTIRRLGSSPSADEPVPVLKPAANKNIISAALSAATEQTYAAVVTGSGAVQQLRVAAAARGQQTDLKEVGLSGVLGHPVWAQAWDDDPAKTVGLITANGRLYSFTATGGPARRVQWQGDPGAITAVSVAPDGYRVAVVSAGKLYRTVINSGGDGITLSTPEQVLPPNLTTVAAVAWSSETSLSVAGRRRDNRFTVLDVTIDGALSTTRLGDIGTEPVTYLTAYPVNPVSGPEKVASESYVAGNQAWDVFSTATRIEPQDLAGPAPGRATGAPSAPFFLG